MATGGRNPIDFDISEAEIEEKPLSVEQDKKKIRQLEREVDSLRDCF